MVPQKIRPYIIWLDKAQSTNTELRSRLSQFDNLSVLAAKEQTEGRGQGSHTWFTSPRTNLTFSILYRFPLEGALSLRASDMILITQVTTLAIRDYLLSEGIESMVKWPNDIWASGKKICGILIENILDGSLISESIVGVGLDVNQTEWPSDLPNPISMKELTGKNYILENELQRLTDAIARRFAYLNTAEGRTQLDKEFYAHLFRLPEVQ